MSNRKENAKPTSNVICNLYPTKPSEYLKLYNPLEAKERDKDKIKTDDELQHDEPILERLLREPDDIKRFSNRPSEEHIRQRGETPKKDLAINPHDQLSQEKYSAPQEGFSKIRLLIKDILHPDHASSLLKILFNSILVNNLSITSSNKTIQDDLSKKRAQEMDAILREINQCRQDYAENLCDPQTRTQATVAFCLEAEKCMNQDPMKAIQSTTLTAELIAEILNEFIEPLGLKTIIVLFSLVVCILLFNCSIRNTSYRTYKREEDEFEHESSFNKFQQIFQRRKDSDVNHKTQNSRMSYKIDATQSGKKQKKN